MFVVDLMLENQIRNTNTNPKQLRLNKKKKKQTNQLTKTTN